MIFERPDSFRGPELGPRVEGWGTHGLELALVCRRWSPHMQVLWAVLRDRLSVQEEVGRQESV